MTMDVAALNSWMERHFTRSAFRLETMQTYEVAADGTDYRRYLDGEPTWTPERKQPWLDTLAAEAKRGLRRSRVRIVTRPVSDYTRYECEWGYAPNVAAGEDVRILDLGERDLPAVGVLAYRDCWIVVDDGGTARRSCATRPSARCQIALPVLRAISTWRRNSATSCGAHRARTSSSERSATSTVPMIDSCTGQDGLSASAW